MEHLIEKCKRKLRLTSTKYVRSVMNDIVWSNRLIALQGAKGVGKTTIMLQYLKIHNCDCKSSLYVSLDDIYFTQHTLSDFVDQFYKKGGHLLMLDEVHKYPHWSLEIKNIYDDYPNLDLVISGSSLLNILAGEADLSRRCIAYTIHGLSYREYLSLAYGLTFEKYNLEQILNHPDEVCNKVNEQCRPLEHFDEYLQSGYYPFFLEDRLSYPLRVENVVHVILNEELPQLCKVDVSSIRKLETLLSLLADNVPMQVDISKLSKSIEVSRATLRGYFQYLQRAKLLNLLYADEGSLKKIQKPEKIYLENPNLMYALSLKQVNIGTLRETFLVGQLLTKHRVEYSSRGDLLVDNHWTIEVGGKNKDGKQIATIENSFIAADNIESAMGNKIPLWVFGFLY